MRIKLIRYCIRKLLKMLRNLSESEYEGIRPILVICSE